MEPDPSSAAATPEHVSLPRQIFNYLWRATWLKCPVCGTRPMFLPVSRTRSLSDWYSPLDGCPRCGYAYDREPGYFLMAHWGLGYGFSAVVAILIYAYLQVWHPEYSLVRTLATVMIPLPIVGFLVARHAKAYFLAIDHLCDPHIPASEEDSDGGGDGGGGRGPRKPPSPVDAPASADPAGQPGSGIAPEREAGARREVEVAERS